MVSKPVIFQISPCRGFS